MKRRIRRRRFYAGEVNHVYQRSRDGFNIFYDVIDYLVYFTVFSVSAKKYDVMVMGLCLMVDHIHMLLRTENRITLSEFVRQVTSVFVMEYNSSICRKGPLFTHRFGSAPKIGDKKIRTSIAYHLIILWRRACARWCRTIGGHFFLIETLPGHMWTEPILLTGREN